jgi:hypothetical protein
MSHVSTVFNQLLQLIPRHDFEKLVREHQGDRYVKNFTCWKQFITLLYAQIKGQDSLRDIVTGLNSQSGKLYHLGMGKVSRSTLSDANSERDYRVYEGLFYNLLEKCESLTPGHGFKFKNPLYSFDSSSFELCLSVFPWAKYKKTKGALKLHCLLDHRGCIPSFVAMTEGRLHDVKAARKLDLPLLPDSIVAMDRGYLDYKYLYNLHCKGVFFVTRTKTNTAYKLTGQHELPSRRGLLGDFSIKFTGAQAKKDYPDELRVVWWYDEEKDKFLEFLTNNFDLAAATIAAIYKARWRIELFFKWIKQNLKIKSFLGTTQNAVMTQIWVAMCYYLLLSYIKFQTSYRYMLRSLARIFKETLMERVSMIDLLSVNPEIGPLKLRNLTHQLALF